MNGEQGGANVTSTRGEINYVRNPTEPGAPPLEFVTEAEEQSTLVRQPGREVMITSARELSTSVDREGFQLLRHTSAVTDFDGIEFIPEANSQYMNEMGELVKAETGALEVIQLGGVKQRFSESATDKLKPLLNAKPARYPHADNTDASSDEQIEFFMQHVAGMAIAEFSRVALYNLWRCVSPPPQDCPLALCDARSVAAGDEVTVTAITQVHGVGEVRHDTTSFVYNPAHRWHYFPDMTPGEVILFKTHDSDTSRARRVAHTAFDDPRCPPGTQPRASVEARILALFA